MREARTIWYILTTLEVIWIVGISIWIVLQRRSPPATLAWIFGLAVLPGIGILVYLFFGPRRLHRKHLERAMAREAVARWTGGKGIPEGALPRLESRRHRELACVGTRGAEWSRVTRNRVRMFFDGDECFEAILDAIRGAEHHVHLEYYIFNPDVWGTRLLTALREKAAEGVAVRLVIDGFGSSRLKSRIRKPLMEAGVELSFFNSFRFSRFKPSLANFRTHRKIVVVDGKTAFTGGMNIMDEHASSILGKKFWHDCHLRLEGPAAIMLQLIFLEDWHYASGAIPEDEGLLPRPEIIEAGTLTQIVSSGPDSDIYGIHRMYFAAISKARERILATTPYFVPDEAILAALTGAALRGVDVRLILPRKTDSFLVGAAAKSYYEDVQKAGVRVFEYQPSMIHAKTMVIDDDIAIVSSANLDNRSFRLNFEVMAVLYDQAEAAKLADQFAIDLEQSNEITVAETEDLAIRYRLIRNTARLFSPIL